MSPVLIKIPTDQEGIRRLGKDVTTNMTGGKSSVPMQLARLTVILN